jgi:hypothetical protein
MNTMRPKCRSAMPLSPDQAIDAGPGVRAAPGGYDLIVDFLSDGLVFPSRSGPLRCPEVRAVQ